MDSQNKLDLEGRLDRHPFAELLIEISQGGLNGALRIEQDKRKVVIYFEDGDLVFAASNAREHRLFEILINEKIITPQQLSEVKDFVNDLKLTEDLKNRQILSKSSVRDIYKQQFHRILEQAVSWKNGEWFFTPLARVRDEMRQPFDFHALLFEYGRSLSGAQSADRLRSLQEFFSLKHKTPEFELKPEEAFILSRFDNRRLTIENLRDLSGISESLTFKFLYALWLGGFLKRENWNAAFSVTKLKEINSAKLTLKTAAPELNKLEESQIQNGSEPNVIKEEATAEKEKPTEKEFTIEDYLNRVANAENFYEILGIVVSASESEIKKAYFSCAKRFHPDLFYKQVETDKHKQIQQSFTEVAQAYETLRNKDTREVYDYKMRKHLEFVNSKTSSESPVKKGEGGEKYDQAAEIFEQGFSLLMDENFAQALPYLTRAVTMAGDNAKYHAYYGRALAENDKKHQAESEMQTAIKLDPENPDYRLMLIKLFIKIGLTKRAEGEVKRLLKIAPENYEAKSLLDSLPTK